MPSGVANQKRDAKQKNKEMLGPEGTEENHPAAVNPVTFTGP